MVLIGILWFVTLFLTSAGVKLSAEESRKTSILKQFIEMHNLGTNEAIVNFIHTNYAPDLVQKQNLDLQIKFYQEIANEFGQLNPAVYNQILDEGDKLIVHLIPKDISVLKPNIPETEILVVEIDVRSGTKYLNRGLGLGSLACENRKKR